MEAYLNKTEDLHPIAPQPAHEEQEEMIREIERMFYSRGVHHFKTYSEIKSMFTITRNP